MFTFVGCGLEFGVPSCGGVSFVFSPGFMLIMCATI
jgi:hypothetical protein